MRISFWASLFLTLALLAASPSLNTLGLVITIICFGVALYRPAREQKSTIESFSNIQISRRWQIFLVASTFGVPLLLMPGLSATVDKGGFFMLYCFLGLMFGFIILLIAHAFWAPTKSNTSGKGKMLALRSNPKIIYWFCIYACLVYFGYHFSQRSIDLNVFTSTSDQEEFSQKDMTEQQKIFQSQLKIDAVYVGQPVSEIGSRSSGNLKYVVLSLDGKASITNAKRGTPANDAFKNPQYKGSYIIDAAHIYIRGKDFLGETFMVGTISKDSLSLRVNKHRGTVRDDPYCEYKRIQ